MNTSPNTIEVDGRLMWILRELTLTSGLVEILAWDPDLDLCLYLFDRVRGGAA